MNAGLKEAPGAITEVAKSVTPVPEARGGFLGNLLRQKLNHKVAPNEPSPAHTGLGQVADSKGSTFSDVTLPGLSSDEQTHNALLDEKFGGRLEVKPSAEAQSSVTPGLAETNGNVNHTPESGSVVPVIADTLTDLGKQDSGSDDVAGKGNSSNGVQSDVSGHSATSTTNEGQPVAGEDADSLKAETSEDSAQVDAAAARRQVGADLQEAAEYRFALESFAETLAKQGGIGGVTDTDEARGAVIDYGRALRSGDQAQIEAALKNPNITPSVKANIDNFYASVHAPKPEGTSSVAGQSEEGSSTVTAGAVVEQSQNASEAPAVGVSENPPSIGDTEGTPTTVEAQPPVKPDQEVASSTLTDQERREKIEELEKKIRSPRDSDPAKQPTREDVLELRRLRAEQTLAQVTVEDLATKVADGTATRQEEDEYIRRIGETASTAVEQQLAVAEARVEAAGNRIAEQVAQQIAEGKDVVVDAQQIKDLQVALQEQTAQTLGITPEQAQKIFEETGNNNNLFGREVRLQREVQRLLQEMMELERQLMRIPKEYKELDDKEAKFKEKVRSKEGEFHLTDSEGDRKRRIELHPLYMQLANIKSAKTKVENIAPILDAQYEDKVRVLRNKLGMNSPMQAFVTFLHTKGKLAVRNLQFDIQAAVR